MKQTFDTPDYPPASDGADAIRLQALAITLMRGKWILLLTLLAVLAVDAIILVLTKPVYEATTSVLIEARGHDGSLPFMDAGGNATTTKITNELETLRAVTTAEDVARELLDITYRDATRTKFLPIIRAEVDGHPAEMKDSLEAVTLRLNDAMDFNPVKDSDIIRISARSQDPIEAAVLANTYARVYAQRNMSASRMKSRQIREFLQTQVASKQQSLDSTEQALQSYMRNSGVVSLDAEANTVVQQLSTLEATRDALDVDISSREKTLNSYRQELATQEPNVAKVMGESSDAYIRLLQEQLARLEVQRDVVIAQNPDLRDDQSYSDKLKEIDNQIQTLKRNLKSRTEAYLGSLVPGDRAATLDGSPAFLSQVKQKIIEQQIELDGLKARKAALNSVVADYERQFNMIPKKSIELAKLQRARLSNERLYLMVEEKFNEAAITETSEFGYIHIMDKAIVPKKPVTPKPGMYLVAGLFLGLMLGTAIVLVRARMDDRIRTPEDLKKRSIVPLATIGSMELAKHKNGKSPQDVASDTRHLDAGLIAHLSPLSPMSEGYRHLRTNVQGQRPDQQVRTILVTSGNPKEGKSTTAGNLAISYAQGESRVLLVDADMRRPAVHDLFGLPKDLGLTDVLFGRKSFEDVVHRRILENLDVLTCGAIPPNPAEILNSYRMREFIKYTKTAYDVVLFDSPPLLAVVDATILCRLMDAVIIIVRSGETSLAELDRVGEVLQGVGKAPTGIVLNGFDMRRAYGGYAGFHPRDRYGYAEGYSDNGRHGSKKRSLKAKA